MRDVLYVSIIIMALAGINSNILVMELNKNKTTYCKAKFASQVFGASIIVTIIFLYIILLSVMW